jgi:hypothetical protein
MSQPKYLLKDLYWSFSEGEIFNKEEFKAQFESYHKSIGLAKKMPFKWGDIAFDYPKIEIQYMLYNEKEEDYDEPTFKLSADNDKNFTYEELLFKIHQVCGKTLEFDDRCYFEGLMFSGTIENNVSLYFMITGS